MSKIIKERDKADILISLNYEKEMNTFWRTWLKGYYNIDHFGINIVLPDHNILAFANTPEFCKIYHDNNYGLYAQGYDTKRFNQYLFYPWRTHNPNKIQKKIHLVSEKIFNMNSGTNFVKKVESNGEIFYILYGISTYKKDPLAYFEWACNMNEIFEICDYAYNTFLPIMQSHCQNYTLPAIEKSPVIPDYIQKILENYVFSREMFVGLSSLIKDIKTPDLASHRVKEGLKVVSNNYYLSNHNASRANLYLVKNDG